MAIRWRKSSRSNFNQNCVELANTRNKIRDSKNPAGPTLPVDLDEFLAAIKADKLNR
jgi:hypothetical protein